MSEKTVERLSNFLGEFYGTQRFDVSKEVLNQLSNIGKDIVKLVKQGKNMEGSKFVSRMRDLEDELHFTIEDFERYLNGG